MIALLLLLALVAGGDRFAMPMSMGMGMGGMQMSDMQNPDAPCKSCDGMKAAMTCDAMCVALPAIAVSSLALSGVRVSEDWTTRSDAATDSSIAPDPSPPRA
jgi:hypothetical protein